MSYRLEVRKSVHNLVGHISKSEGNHFLRNSLFCAWYTICDITPKIESTKKSASQDCKEPGWSVNQKNRSTTTQLCALLILTA